MNELSPRQRLLEFLLGPSIDLFMKHGITPLLIGFIGLTIMEYFFMLHKRQKKNRFTAYEWFSIVIWFGLLIMTIDSQIVMIVRREGTLWQ